MSSVTRTEIAAGRPLNSARVLSRRLGLQPESCELLIVFVVDGEAFEREFLELLISREGSHAKTFASVPESIRQPLATAESELAAFLGAVEKLLGPEQVSQAAEDWLEELESAEWPVEGRPFAWRRLTISAAGRLARNIDASTRSRVVDTRPQALLFR